MERETLRQLAQEVAGLRLADEELIPLATQVAHGQQMLARLDDLPWDDLEPASVYPMGED